MTRRLFILLIVVIGVLLAIRFVFEQSRNRTPENTSDPGKPSALQLAEEQTTGNGYRKRWQPGSGAPVQAKQPIIWYERLTEGAPSAFPDEEALQRYLAAEESEREKAVRADIAAGLNETVRNRESRLRSQSAKLKTGLPMNEVVNTLGTPNEVHARIQSASMLGRQPVKEMEKLGMDREIYFTYSPNPDDIFDDANGISYQVLTILFATNRTIVRWSWETPVPTVSFGRGFRKWESKQNATNRQE